jgi:hypothetical protein
VQYVDLYGITSIEILLTGMPCCSISICSHPVSTAANTSGLTLFEAHAYTRTHAHDSVVPASGAEALNFNASFPLDVSKAHVLSLRVVVPSGLWVSRREEERNIETNDTEN